MDNFSNNLSVVRTNKRYLGLSAAEFIKLFPVSQPDDDLCVLMSPDSDCVSEEPIEEGFWDFSQMDRGERIHLTISLIINVIVMIAIGIDQFLINLPAEPIEYTEHDIQMMRLEYFRDHGFPNGYPKETKEAWENFYGEEFDWKWEVYRETNQY